MIGFNINGEFLDLPEDRSVELNRNSPLFQQDGFIVEDYTLPSTFPNTPKNMRILNFPHIVENSERQRPRWPCTLYYNGVPRLVGELRIQRPVNRRVINANFVSGISMIAEDIKERSLRDIVTGEFVIHEREIFKTLTIDYVAAFYDRLQLSINGANYDEGNMTDLVNAINADVDQLIGASAVSNQLTLTNSVAGEFAPMHIQLPETRLDEDNNPIGTLWVLIGAAPAWLDTYRDDLTDFVNTYKGAGRISEPLRFGSFANFDKFFGEESPIKQFPAVNLSDSNGFQTSAIVTPSFSTIPEVFNPNSMAPMVTVAYVLAQIEEYYDITIHFPDLNPDDVFFHNWVLDRPIDFLNTRKLILFEREFTAKQLVPDMKVNDLIKALQIGYNARVDYDPRTRTLSIINRQAAIRKREYIDITDDATPPSNVSLSFQKGLKLKLRKDNGDKLEFDIDAPLDFILGEGERVIEIPFGTPAMRDHVGQGYWPQGVDYPTYTAAIDQPSGENFSFRLARYTESIFNQIIESTPFFLLGENGIVEVYWKDAFVLENDPVYIECRWLMTREQAFALDWNQKWRIDRSDFFLQKFNVTLMANGLAMADCTFIRVPVFQIATVDPRILAWYGDPNTIACVKEDGVNTGMATYQYLYELDETNIPSIPTGRVKVNVDTDPDYIAPFEDLTQCPLPGTGFQVGNLYITQLPFQTGDPSQLVINNVNYNNPNAIANPAPYPFVMPLSGTGVKFVAYNNSAQVVKYRVKSYIGTSLSKSLEVTVYPGNTVNGLFGPTTAEIYRSLFFTTALGDLNMANYNRIIIEKEII